MLHSLFGSLTVLILCLVAAVHPFSYDSFQVIERLASVPDGWTQGPAPDKSTLLRFRLAVRLEKEELFYQRLLNISTPGNPIYGLHMTRDEVKDFLRPRPTVSAQLLSWLTSSGVASDQIEDDGSWISFRTTVEQAERLLNTSFYYFIDGESKDSKIRTLEYSVPSSIVSNVHMIQPTTMFATFRPQRSTLLRMEEVPSENLDSNIPRVCRFQMQPACLRDLYNFTDFKPIPGTTNKIGVSGFLEQYAQYADLKQFLSLVDPAAVGSTFSVQSINGGLNTQGGKNNSMEANLDIQYIVSLSRSPNVTYFTTGGRGPLIPDIDQPDPNNSNNEPYLEQVLYLLALPDDELPNVLSTSYGDNEQSIPDAYAEALCCLYAQLSARGVSIIFSSGDSGVGSSCRSNDGALRTVFNPIFPATCPFVTSVGATRGYEPEEAANFSSGGFSAVFERPAYQDKAVLEYLKKLGNKWTGLYNRNGRGFPDVAAHGVLYFICDKGTTDLVSGTSASAPTFAAIISLLNTIRESRNQPPLGFLNPWLYSFGYMGLTDIVDGGSKGCTGVSITSHLPGAYVPYASWNATPGWDPVTGLGTPNFPKLVSVLPDTECGAGGLAALESWQGLV
ncbi:hypothetical protein AJ78_03474 [Emergomyces pasteurianus Ep9510]|uniref:tripeptidyl-peptidase II n=1 Tax=Emergomyces pasteurianus Ep9510 TaxID=1447872 RepID=A0A1J9QM96_9EURO|nr:hypothetical protein AJ78_03474 [Emergomyces pasteurianus Ep9510]